MPPDALLKELLRVAGRVGLEVRKVGVRSRLPSAGGPCTINGRALIVLNGRAGAMEQSAVLADGLAGRDLGAVEMSLEVRGFIAARASNRMRLLLPRRPPGPGLAACRAPSRRVRGSEGRQP